MWLSWCRYSLAARCEAEPGGGAGGGEPASEASSDERPSSRLLMDESEMTSPWNGSRLRSVGVLREEVAGAGVRAGDRDRREGCGVAMPARVVSPIRRRSMSNL